MPTAYTDTYYCKQKNNLFFIYNIKNQLMISLIFYKLIILIYIIMKINFTLLLFITLSFQLKAQSLKDILKSMEWRNIGPDRGGRSLAVAGSSRVNEYYFGAVGGGLWKTTDGGQTWGPVTDG